MQDGLVKNPCPGRQREPLTAAHMTTIEVLTTSWSPILQPAMQPPHNQTKAYPGVWLAVAFWALYGLNWLDRQATPLRRRRLWCFFRSFVSGTCNALGILYVFVVGTDCDRSCSLRAAILDVGHGTMWLQITDS